MKRMLILAAVWAATQIADGLMTWYFVSWGMVQEANPLMAPLADSPVFPTLKAAGGLVFGVLLYMAGTRLGKTGVVVASLIAMVSIGIIFYNLLVLVS